MLCIFAYLFMWVGMYALIEYCFGGERFGSWWNGGFVDLVFRWTGGFWFLWMLCEVLGYNGGNGTERKFMRLSLLSMAFYCILQWFIFDLVSLPFGIVENGQRENIWKKKIAVFIFSEPFHNIYKFPKNCKWISFHIGTLVGLWRCISLCQACIV